VTDKPTNPGRLGPGASTHQVTCMVCEQTFGNHEEHTCPFTGIEHAKMHRDASARLVLLEEAVKALVARERHRVGRLGALEDLLVETGTLPEFRS